LEINEKEYEMEKKTAKVDNRYYRLDFIREAVDIVIGDDGFRGKEVLEVLKTGFPHIHYPIYINGTCEYKHKDKECEILVKEDKDGKEE
tara:strand:- start:140 stop:406 length:267 start_codon:yes stop_codon:yes gene_type:complete